MEHLDRYVKDHLIYQIVEIPSVPCNSTQESAVSSKRLGTILMIILTTQIKWQSILKLSDNFWDYLE